MAFLSFWGGGRYGWKGRYDGSKAPRRHWRRLRDNPWRGRHAECRLGNLGDAAGVVPGHGLRHSGVLVRRHSGAGLRTGFDPTSGFPTGDVFLKVTCSGSGRGGRPTTHTTWAGVTRAFTGVVVSSAAVSRLRPSTRPSRLSTRTAIRSTTHRTTERSREVRRPTCQRGTSSPLGPVSPGREDCRSYQARRSACETERLPLTVGWRAWSAYPYSSRPRRASNAHRPGAPPAAGHLSRSACLRGTARS